MRSEVQKRPHPGLATLALYSTGDLSWMTRLRLRGHIGNCAICSHQVELFRGAKESLRREATSETLTAFEAIADWNRLEREMLGNIAVGVAAARCIDNVHHGRRWLMRSAVIAGLTILFAAGWMTHIPKEQDEHLLASIRQWAGMERPAFTGTIVRTTPDGIAVRAQGATLTILHPPSAVVSLSGASAVAARYVDEETGQVTITKVYGQ